MKPLCAALTTLALSSAFALAQNPQPTPPQTPAQKAAMANVHHEANFDDERKQADALYTSQHALEALPLYIDLCRQDPSIAVFAERHAGGLFAKASTEQDAAAAKRDHDEAISELQRAQALGDNSNYVLSMLELVKNGTADSPGYHQTQNADALAAMKEAEAAFSKRDLKTALAAYIRAGEADPSYYGAKLYAGDACFSGGDYACAGEWFAKAIALDPNRETAYRYWGDALYKSGKSHEALEKYEQAIVAEPYVRLSWGGLLQWAQLTKTQMGSISINRAKVDPANNTHINITLDPSAPPSEMAFSIAYAGCRMGATKENVAKAAGTQGTTVVPTPPYSPELETECLDLGATAVLETKPKDSALTPGMRGLLALKKDGMIECWVLLNSGDPQDSHSYAAYRDAHRDLLVAYLNKYVVHEGVAATQAPQLNSGK